MEQKAKEQRITVAYDVFDRVCVERDRLKEINRELVRAFKWMKHELCEAWDEPEEKAIPAEHLTTIAKAEKETS